MGISFLQLLQRYMGVDLGGANAGMTQQLLNDADIHAPIQQMGRKTVPQHVRMHRHVEPAFVTVILHPVLDTS